MKQKSLFGYLAPLHQRPPKDKPSSEWFDPSSFLVKGQETLPEENEDKPQFTLGLILMGAAVLLLGSRLTTLQITEGAAHRYLAEGNRIRRQVTVAPRGAIVDRKGVALVTNEPGYRLELVPSDLPNQKADRQGIYQTVSAVLNRPYDDIVKQVEQAGFTSLEPITLADRLDREQALLYRLKFANMSGVRVSFLPSRRYDATPGLAHILGYTSTMTEEDVKRHSDYHPSSPIGRSGLESSYDTELRGVVGSNEVEVDANGKFQRLLQNIPPKEGQTLHLSLDKGLQEEMVHALQEAMGKEQAKQAAAIAMNPNDGSILASVSLPTYDNNLFARGIKSEDYAKLSNDPDKPLLNRVTDGEYPSGSTIKPFVAAAALQEGTIRPDTKLDTSAGKIVIGQWEFPDWKVHGMADVRQAIAESNDIFFYAVGGGWEKIPGLGVDRMKKYLHMFGFGEPTNLDFASDNTGLVPDEAWKKKVIKEAWYIGDTYHMAIGQGDLLATPLQLARATSSIANGGRLITPHVVASVESTDSQKDTPLTFQETKLSLRPEVLQVVREGMRRTVEAGSARTLNTLPFSSAGKTGTAEFGTEKKTHAWYIGYAPYENPQIAVAIIVEGGGEGNAISVPVASRAFSYYMGHR